MNDWINSQLAPLIIQLIADGYLDSPKVTGTYPNPYLNDIKTVSGKMGWLAFVAPPTAPNGEVINAAQDNMFYRSGFDSLNRVREYPYNKNYTLNHELDHILYNRAGNKGEDYYFDNPLKKKFSRDLSTTLLKNKNAIIKKYPNSGVSYMIDPEGVKPSELMAELNAIEDTYGVDLIKDPIFADLFRSKANKEIYKAATGYRRTRMDAKDPKPYTPNMPSFWENLLDLFKGN